MDLICPFTFKRMLQSDYGIKFNLMWIFYSLSLLAIGEGQVNKPPAFTFDGDMDRFSIREDTLIGTAVYTLKALDPEGSRIIYGLNSDYLAVDKETGNVTLIKKVDRELEDSIDVVISASDEKLFGTTPNTITLKRQIAIIDANDNTPKFLNTPYMTSVNEMASKGSMIYDGILVVDKDSGVNSEITLQCLNNVSPEGCNKFDVNLKQISSGEYQGQILLKDTLDYEQASMYILTIKAEDMANTNRRSSVVNVIIEVIDAQDQPPQFLNAPYFVSLAEGTLPGTELLSFQVRDGDKGNPNPLNLTMTDEKGYFSMMHNHSNGLYKVTIKTSDTVLDREDPFIMKNDGQYTIYIEAQEIDDENKNLTSTKTTITLLITDANDNLPTMSSENFTITIREDIPVNSLLPEIDLVVNDVDTQENGKYELFLESEDNAKEIFAIEPTSSQNETPVTIKIINTRLLDYENPDRRMFNFQIVARDEFGRESKAKVQVNVEDVNDNSPIFDQNEYHVNVSENSVPGTVVATITAKDADSGENAVLHYDLKGFGAEWFTVNPTTGQISVGNCGATHCLDFEKLSQYVLTYSARDESGKTAVTTLVINVIDANDNPPTFLQRELIRNVPFGVKELIPPLFVKATDKDSSRDGNNNITYKLLDSDSSLDLFSINSRSGEITLNEAFVNLNKSHYPHGFTLHLEAADSGTPSLTGDAYLIIILTESPEKKLIFLQPFYNVSLLETATGGTNVVQVTTSHPHQITQNATSYSITSGAHDNFVVDGISGIISVAPNTSLDLELEPHSYTITVEAVHSDTLVQLTATTTVHVTIEDVNNKSPKFLQEYYVAYISNSTAVGDVILNLKATDDDSDHLLQYSIADHVTARDRYGILMPPEVMSNVHNALHLNTTNGDLSITSLLSHDSYSVLYLIIEVQDINANLHYGEQRATVEAVLYIAEIEDSTPRFPFPWAPTLPQIIYSIPEEPPIGARLFTLTAKSPSQTSAITFEKIEDENNYVSIDPNTGVVTLVKRLDYEQLPPSKKQFSFVVKVLATNDADLKSSTATIIVDVQDTNDNSPVFTKEVYHVNIAESASYPYTVLVVHATDNDQQLGFGDIRYSLSNDGLGMFNIDPNTGTITLTKEKHLDRETKATYNLKVTATDNPNGYGNQRRTSALVTVEVMDVNDNAPKFLEPLYQAVIPETVAPGFIIKQVQAFDLDLGESGHITFSVHEKSQLKEFLSINGTTGTLSVGKALPGKGRIEPYRVIISATDHGKPPLSSEVHVLIFITDVSTNDGIPTFIKPSPKEVVYVPENSPSGTVVTLVKATDPDDPKTDSGRLRYSFLGEAPSNSDQRHFSIDSVKGTITTRHPLDRENQVNYTVVIIVKDSGTPPQQSAQLLTIQTTDVDDHPPQFVRPKNCAPLEYEIEEEVPFGTIIGYIEANDEDEGENAAMQYIITDGNEDSVFSINRTADNRGIIYAKGRLDSEERTSYLITIQVKRYKSENGEDNISHQFHKLSGKERYSLDEKSLHQSYDPSDFSMVQAIIRIQDIDDHPPVFLQENMTTGIKANTEPGLDVFVFEAFDKDSTTTSITYHLVDIKFHFFNEETSYKVDDGFLLNSDTGTLRTSQSMSHYENGFFIISVKATSKNKSTYASLMVYVLRENEMLKFVFNKPLAEVRKSLTDFQTNLQDTLQSPIPIKVNLYDAHFAAQSGSVNISSLCFNFIVGDNLMTSSEAEAMLDLPSRPRLALIYNDYSVQTVENCSTEGTLYTMNWIEICILIVASLIASIAFASAIIICKLHNRYRKLIHPNFYQGMRETADTNGNGYSTINRQRIREWQERSTPLRDISYGPLHA